MRNWFFSLQFRLILSFALVLTLALAGVSAYVGLAADREAEKLQSNTDEARARRITHALERFYSNNGGMEWVSSLYWSGRGSSQAATS